MTSTELNMGLPEARRPSSRVLKPPGGGHTNIFAEPETVAARPRPKHDQQNSSNLNCVMNTTDPNVSVAKTNETIEQAKQTSESVQSEPKQKSENQPQESPNNSQGGRVRVPPGGFSSGLW